MARLVRHSYHSRGACLREGTCDVFGLLNLDKPPGWTSRDAVNRVQRMVRPHKVGHAGTLDPLARGVLVLCLGQATRLIPYIQRMHKSYRGEFLLGRESDTEDVEGSIRELQDPLIPTREELAAALPRFRGRIEQVPPAYSALKVQGRRAYDLARQGQSVELAARTIEIHELTIVEYAYPHLTLDIRCGSGTYVRSLGRDLARAVGSGAVMSALQRTAIGPFQLSEACPVETLTTESLNKWLLPAALAVAGLTQVQLSDAELARLQRGQKIEDRFQLTCDEAAGLRPDGQLAVLLTRSTETGQLRPLRNFDVS